MPDFFSEKTTNVHDWLMGRIATAVPLPFWISGSEGSLMSLKYQMDKELPDNDKTIRVKNDILFFVKHDEVPKVRHIIESIPSINSVHVFRGPTHSRKVKQRGTVDVPGEIIFESCEVSEGSAGGVAITNMRVSSAGYEIYKFLRDSGCAGYDYDFMYERFTFVDEADRTLFQLYINQHYNLDNDEHDVGEYSRPYNKEERIKAERSFREEEEDSYYNYSKHLGDYLSEYDQVVGFDEAETISYCSGVLKRLKAR